MFTIQYRNKDDIIVERIEARIPLKGEGIAFFSYNNNLDTKQMKINEYYVIHIVSMLRDPAPPKDFSSDNIGIERYLVFLQPKAEYEKLIAERHKSNDTTEEQPPVQSEPT